METNERFIKLSSRLPFDKDIQLGTDITFLIEGKQFIANCVKIEYEDQQDGTQNVSYKLILELIRPHSGLTVTEMESGDETLRRNLTRHAPARAHHKLCCNLLRAALISRVWASPLRSGSHIQTHEHIAATRQLAPLGWRAT
jgi:hypothetical protein